MESELIADYIAGNPPILYRWNNAKIINEPKKPFYFCLNIYIIPNA